MRAICELPPRPVAAPSDGEQVSALPSTTPTPLAGGSPTAGAPPDRPHRPEEPRLRATTLEARTTSDPGSARALGRGDEHPPPRALVADPGVGAAELWTSRLLETGPSPRQRIESTIAQPRTASSRSAERTARSEACVRGASAGVRASSSLPEVAPSGSTGAAGTAPAGELPDAAQRPSRAGTWRLFLLLIVIYMMFKFLDMLGVSGPQRWLDVARDHPLRSALAVLLLSLAAQPLRSPTEARLAVADDSA